MCLIKSLYYRSEKVLYPYNPDSNVETFNFPVIGEVDGISPIKLKNRLDVNKVFIGYKILEHHCLNAGQLTLKSLYNDFLELKQWYKCNYSLEKDWYGNAYLAGFHILATMEDVLNYNNLICRCYNKTMIGHIYKVAYKNILGFGLEIGESCVILASEMKVLEKVKHESI